MAILSEGTQVLTTLYSSAIVLPFHRSLDRHSAHSTAIQRHATAASIYKNYPELGSYLEKSAAASVIPRTPFRISFWDPYGSLLTTLPRSIPSHPLPSNARQTSNRLFILVPLHQLRHATTSTKISIVSAAGSNTRSRYPTLKLYPFLL